MRGEVWEIVLSCIIRANGFDCVSRDIIAINSCFLLQGYLIFWRDDPASPIREADLNGLFSNIEDIYEFNRYGIFSHYIYI